MEYGPATPPRSGSGWLMGPFAETGRQKLLFRRDEHDFGLGMLCKGAFERAKQRRQSEMEIPNSRESIFLQNWDE